MTQGRFSKFQEYVLPALVLLVLAFFFFRTTQTQFPAHIHAWTQSDRYALAVGFTENGYDFFHPATLNLKPRYEAAIPLEDPQGITSVDFPIIEYLAALLMGIYGQPAPWIFRTLMLLLGLSGLFFWFRFLREVGVNYGLSLSGLLLAFTAPVFTYYLNGFIPSTSAVAMSFVALYLFVRYLRNEKINFLITALIFLTMAALIRKPFVMGLLAWAGAFVLIFWKEKSKLRIVLPGFLASLAVVGFYHVYNKFLSFTYGSLFISDLMPADAVAETIQLIQISWANWKLTYFSLPAWIWIGIAISGLVFKGFGDKTNKVIGFSALLWLAASGLYLLAMARQFPAHDYYFLDSIFLPLLILLGLGLRLLSKIERPFQWSILIIAFALNGWMLKQSYAIQSERNTFKSWDRTEITRRNFEGGAKLLAEAKVPPNAKILVLDAYTTNMPLLLLERKGYTVINTTHENLRQAMKWDFDFVAIQNSFLASDIIRNYPDITQKLQPVANNGKIGIFLKRENSNSLSYKELTLLDQQLILLESSKLKRQYPESNFSNEGLIFEDAFLPLADTILHAGTKPEISLFFEAEIHSANLPKKLFLVMDASSDDGSKHYESFDLKPFFEADSTFGRPALMMQLPQDIEQQLNLRIYLWNAGEQYLCIENLDFKLIQYQNKLSQYPNDYEEY
ncbi:MAG: hypothetical protein PHN50_12695 [Bacteroidales bacterium]|nr:hypothetical protein [Bacteroidales bacterium]